MHSSQVQWLDLGRNELDGALLDAFPLAQHLSINENQLRGGCPENARSIPLGPEECKVRELVCYEMQDRS